MRARRGDRVVGTASRTAYSCALVLPCGMAARLAALVLPSRTERAGSTAQTTHADGSSFAGAVVSSQLVEIAMLGDTSSRSLCSATHAAQVRIIARIKGAVPARASPLPARARLHDRQPPSAAAEPSSPPSVRSAGDLTHLDHHMPELGAPLALALPLPHVVGDATRRSRRCRRSCCRGSDASEPAPHSAPSIGPSDAYGGGGVSTAASACHHLCARAATP